ncbi:restriction endonuclease subunit S [Demequina sp. NBRC 110052]|uniref:restriction endonuclease subunit S n=1 Tax=Demequina sp. NBRC 110052 TaxID=1570341 RepID=UPI000A0497DD|nr:restriction endonuclease subunit S [Demequina sp. NBRC 110052]
MAADWRQTTIGDLIAESGGEIKTGPFGTTLKAHEYSSIGVPVISVGEVGYGSLRVTEKTPLVPEEVVARLPEYLLREGDIVFGRKGAVDRSALVKSEQDGWFLGSDGIRLRLPETVDCRFFAYQLQTAGTRAWLLQHSTGTTMASLNQKTVARIPVVVPPIDEQRRIAHILGTLDDKIELNRRMNETLEEMARALFKSWFVDFDPVRAKAEGRDPGLPKHLADLFPDRLVDSELGKTPEGWPVVEIGELAGVVGGSTPSTKVEEFWTDGTVPFATPKDLSRLTSPVLQSTERYITNAGLTQIGSGALPVGTVLMSSRAPIGYLAVTDTHVAINQGFIAMFPATDVSNIFLLLWAQHAQPEIVARANGSTFLEISKSSFRGIKVVRCSPAVMAEFDRQVRPLYDRIVAGVSEKTTLVDARDRLLAELFSPTPNVTV